MKIVLCIKQVPDTSDIKWTENNTIQREGLESIMNTFDTYGLEAALRIKNEDNDVQISAITMGPPQAENVIREAIALGVDNGFVITDKKFAGADTIATSTTLAAAVQNKIGNADLIICGQYAIDGDTAQTPAMLAQKLGYSQVTYVREIVDFKNNIVTAKRETEDGIEIVNAELPCVISFIKPDYPLSRPLINGFKTAQMAEIPCYSMEDIGLSAEVVGIKGSPTYVSKAFRPEQKHCGQKFKPETVKDAVNIIMENINV
ncbi:electron transfer flavoprotein subunit beta/FixA family protein [bacterium]|nr:electron transfer flavoprotein subunit beta/FixA family protein [bacterium]